MPRSVLAAVAAALLAAACAGQPSGQVASAPTPTVPASPSPAATPAPSHDELVRRCLFDSIDAYPTWPQPSVNVLDGLASCKGLPQADKTHLRQMVRAFVTEYDRRSS